MNSRQVKKDDVIQIIEEGPHMGCLFIVRKVTSTGVEVAMRLPRAGLDLAEFMWHEFVLIGRAQVVL